MMKNDNINLSHIPYLNHIHNLAQYDSDIRLYCEKVVFRTYPKFYCDDVVQDSYIKLFRAISKGGSVNGGFIAVTLHNTFKTMVGKEKRLDRNYEDYGSNIYEDGMHIKTNFDSICIEDDNYFEILEEKLENERLYEEIDRRVSKLRWYDRQIFIYSQQMSLLELSRRTGISYRKIYTSYNDSKLKIGIIKKDKKR